MDQPAINQDVLSKVQELLLGVADQVTLVKNGVFSVRQGSSRAFIEVRTKEAFSWVRLVVPILQGLTETPELLKYVAYNDDYIFGHLFLENWDDSITLMFEHALLADYLDEAELGHALGGMIAVADELDDDLKNRFGGARFHEDV